MVAQLIDGKACAATIRNEIAAEIATLQRDHPTFQPRLAIIQVADRPDSSTYVRMKRKAAREANIDVDFVHFSEDDSEDAVLSKIAELNKDPNCHGIIVQLPLPTSFNEDRITSAVAATKDVDGFGSYNVGELNKRHGKPFFLPCTPKGIIELLHRYNVKLEGSRSVVLGRSDIVGSPVAELLKSNNSTVTVLHSRSRDIPDYMQTADIVVAAIGKPEFIKGDWFVGCNPDCVVIDVGTNYIPDSTKKSGMRCVGDVEFQEVKEHVGMITPVPGGVGPMTVAMLMMNTLTAAKRALEQQQQQLTTASSRGYYSPLPLALKRPVPSDFEISRAQRPKPITVVAEESGILLDSEFEPYGSTKGKVDLSILKRLAHRKNGKYVLVAGITPTPLGEGKSTTTIGLAQALGAHLNKRAFANVRQPSMGPTFGIKGGAAGGGYSQVIPMDEFNLHLTGDIHAISMANNLLAAAIDTRMFHESTQKDGPLYNRLVPRGKDGARKFTPSMLRRLKKLGIDKTDPDTLTPEEINRFARLNIDPDSITWRRVVDCNDRFLREITIGESPTERGHTRKTGFDISVASECMAILALCESLGDMRERLGRIVVGTNKETGEPVTCEDIGCAGAMTALLKDAIKPNLMQTLEGTPVLVHAGPFANISIGASSVLADKVALKLVGTEGETSVDEPGYVITEAGFDFTIGGERFLNIKCRSSGLVPDVVVIVATVRALKVHGGGPDIKPGAPLSSEYTSENLLLLKEGCANLAKHISNAKQYNLPVVVAINKMSTDTPREHELIIEESIKAGASAAVVSNHWEEGGKGAIGLAEAVIKVCQEEPSTDGFKFLYDLDKEQPSIESRITKIAQDMYGARDVSFSEEAQRKIATYTKQGFANLPICIAKTQYSLSHDPALKGVPKDFTFPIRDVRIATGANYLYALAAEIQTIPGLPTHCGFMNIEVNDDGEIEGMF